MTEEYWSRFADTYDEKQRAVVGDELLDEMRRQLGALPPLGSALELGCGTGYFTKTIADRCKSLVATDLSEQLLDAARARLRDHDGVRFQQEDCMATSFAAASFDSVCMANLIHVVADPAQVLRECRRVLRPGGRIVILTFTRHGMSAWERLKMGGRFVRTWGKPPAHMHIISPESLSALAEDSGFFTERSQLLGQATRAVFLLAHSR